AAGASAEAAASAPPPARWIVFAGTPPGVRASQLFRIRTSGKGLKQLTSGQLPSIAPNFSPDGKRIAFARNGVGILMMNIDGTGLHRLTTNPRDSFPAWSPDGTQITFVRPSTTAWNVVVMPAKGGKQSRLRQAPSSGRPTWSTHGFLIPSGGDLLRIDPLTGHVQKYYDADIDATWGMNTVAISPAATLLTFVGARNPDPGDLDCGDGPCPRFALYTESIKKASRPKLLAKDAGPATFSPDGRQLAFVAKGGLVLWTLANGTSRLVATGTAYPNATAPPAWQPR
ncbi:MAG: hypothetical protein QOF43_1137, partial [Gaiellaceae bacterium]|nr:hypothetical protein [Gaiellaceae bacterium]